MQIACNLGRKVASPNVDFYIEICSFRFSSLVCLPYLKKQVQYVLTFALSCSSAAAERVFSLVDAMFGEDQRTSLADQVQAGVMLLTTTNKRMVQVG